MEHIITTQNLSFEYHTEEQTRHLVLKDINLQFKKGQFIGIIGHNGSGKSTLAKHFNALLVPTEGKVYVKGMDTKDAKHLWDIRQSAGLVFQNPDNQIVAAIVEEDVAFGPENLGISPDEIKERVEYALKAVGMWEYKDYPPHMLSGGQKQRVAIAGIIAMKPECIILDEPTAMLDPIGRKEVISTIKNSTKKRKLL